MLDFGFAELLVIIAVAVLVIGPEEIPPMMRALGRIVRRLQYVRYAFSQQFEDFMREQDLDELRKSVNFEARDSDEEDDEIFAALPVEKPENKKPKQKKAAPKKTVKKPVARKKAPAKKKATT